MTRRSNCADGAARSARRAVRLSLALPLAWSLSLLLPCAACGPDAPAPPRAPSAARDARPFTPWHPIDAPSPFPEGEWYWQELFAVAPAPEPLPADPAAAAEIAATLERIAGLELLQSESELPGLVALARRDLAALLAALDDPRPEARFAAARVMVRLMTARTRPEGCPFPQRLVAAAAVHLRDRADDVALLHLETIARGGYPWSWPVLLKCFGKLDNHRLTVLRVRAAALLAMQGCYGGMPLLIKVLKEGTSIQDDRNREWDPSFQTAWWKEEAIAGIAAVAGQKFGHSPDASDADQVAAVRRIEAWWQANAIELYAKAPPLDDPELIARIRLLIRSFGTFQLRNVDNAGFLLAALGPGVVPHLFEALDGSSFMVRRHVLAVLAELAPRVAVEVRQRWLTRLLPLLTEGAGELVPFALQAVGALRIDAALPHLEAALRPEAPEACEAALYQLSRQSPRLAREVLQRFATKLPPQHRLTTPLAAARLRAGDLAPLPEYLKRLSGEANSDARAQLYLSWIVDFDGWSDAKTAEERRTALERIEAEIRARAASSGS
ncbi:MAG: hypothetical protein JNL90_13855 [Planctomycetes bacterium]|nr:hypothetical protein [Planctomycetota bacterium]